jgi:hypothetical protein
MWALKEQYLYLRHFQRLEDDRAVIAEFIDAPTVSG